MHFYKTTKATNDHTKSEEDKYNTMSLMCVIKKKIDRNELIYKTKVDSQT